MSDPNHPGDPEGADLDHTEDARDEAASGGAAWETPEGKELAPDPDGSGVAGGDTMGLEEERGTDADTATTDLRASEEESSNNEWAP